MTEFLIDAVGPIPVDRDAVIVTERARKMLLEEGWASPECNTCCCGVCGL